MSKDTRILAGDKEAGQVKDKTLVIIKTSYKHFVKKFQGYGISPFTLDESELLGAELLQLTGYDGEQFNLTINQFRAAAIRSNLGYGDQLFMSVKNLRYYTKANKKPLYRNEPIQIGMFEGA